MNWDSILLVFSEGINQWPLVLHDYTFLEGWLPVFLILFLTPHLCRSSSPDGGPREDYSPFSTCRWKLPSSLHPQEWSKQADSRSLLEKKFKDRYIEDTRSCQSSPRTWWRAEASCQVKWVPASASLQCLGKGRPCGSRASQLCLRGHLYVEQRMENSMPRGTTKQFKIWWKAIKRRLVAPWCKQNSSTARNLIELGKRQSRRPP